MAWSQISRHGVPKNFQLKQCRFLLKVCSHEQLYSQRWNSISLLCTVSRCGFLQSTCQQWTGHLENRSLSVDTSSKLLSVIAGDRCPSVDTAGRLSSVDITNKLLCMYATKNSLFVDAINKLPVDVTDRPLSVDATERLSSVDITNRLSIDISDKLSHKSVKAAHGYSSLPTTYKNDIKLARGSVQIINSTSDSQILKVLSFYPRRSMSTTSQEHTNKQNQCDTPTKIVTGSSSIDSAKTHLKTSEGDQTMGRSGQEGVDEAGQKLTLYQRFKKTYKEHGKVLVAVHLVTSAVWFGSFYTVARCGIDVVSFMENLNFSEKIISPFRSGGLGDVAVAYLMYKLATPARYTVTIGGTNLAIRYLRKEGKIPHIAEEDRIRSLYKESKEHIKRRSRVHFRRLRKKHLARSRAGHIKDKH